MKSLRLIALALALTICLIPLTACGGGGGSATQPPATTAGGSAEETPSGGDEQPVSGDPIKVGILGPYTGPVAQYGLAVRYGAELYVKQINAAGGVNGKQIEISIYDEEGDPAKAVTGYNDLVDKGVTAIIGDVTTGPTLAVVPIAFEDNMPMITASATAMNVTYDEAASMLYTNMFRSCFIDPVQSRTMAKFAKEILEANTAAVLFNIGDDYSLGLKDAFVATCEELGIEIVASEAFGDGAVDFQSQLTNIADKNPDVLFVPTYYETVALVATQAKNAGLTATMLGCDGWDTVVSILPDSALLEGAYYCSGYSTGDPTEIVQSFLKDYEAEYGEAPNTFSATGYDAAMILVAALEKAESQGLAAGSDEYKQAVIDAMSATDLECVTGRVTFDEYNNPEKSTFMINITGGEAKFWGKY